MRLGRDDACDPKRRVVASCVWDWAGEMTLLRAFWDAAREIDPERAAAADEGVVMAWSGPGELGDLWRAAGLRDVRFWWERAARTSTTCGPHGRPAWAPQAQSASR